MVERFYDRSEGGIRDGQFAIAGGDEATCRALAALPPFLRALLVTDGTVTKILEAYFWEPITVETLSQASVIAEKPIPWLGIEPGSSVLTRDARLIGTDTATAYADAFSIIRTELIPEDFRRRLIAREIGIGVLIRDSGLESYRELLELGTEQTPSAPDGQRRISRTYRIIIEGNPVILITESFPYSVYAA